MRDGLVHPRLRAPACATARYSSGRSWASSSTTPRARRSSAKCVVVEDDVRALAAEFLGHPLHRRCGVLRHLDAGAGRAGERHHVDVGMARQSATPTPGPSPLTRLNTPAGTPAASMISVKMLRRERRDLGRLQHHRAAGGQRREHLARDLVDRPVPRRDQAAHADRLLDDQRRAVLLLEREVLQHLDGRRQVTDAEAAPAARRPATAARPSPR